MRLKHLLKNWKKRKMGLFEISANWIDALAKTLFHSLWIGLILLSLLKAGLQLIPERFSNIRYRLGIISLLVFTGTIATLFFRLYSPLLISADWLPADFRSRFLFASMKGETGISDTFSLRISYYLLSYFYFIGLFVFTIRTILSVSSVWRVRNCGIRVNGEWLRKFNQMKSSLGISKRVGFYISYHIHVPALIGLIKPAIIIPAGMLSNLPISQVEVILLHELSHFKRLDFLMNLLQLIAEVLFFYNPSVWIMSKMIRMEREKCCDDKVTQVSEHPLTYAKALLNLAEWHRSLGRVVLSVGGTGRSHLYDRINRILNQTTMKSNIRERLMALVLFLAGALLLLTISGFSSGLSIVHQNQYSEIATYSEPAIVIDTVPAEVEQALKDMEKAIEKIDWEEIEMDIREAKEEVMNQIDRKEFEQELTKARIHMDSLKENMDLDMDIKIDLEGLREEMEEAMKEIEEINWEDIKMELEKSRAEIDKIDMGLIFEDVRKALEEVDLEKIQKEIESVLEGIDLEEMKIEMEELQIEMKELEEQQEISESTR